MTKQIEVITSVERRRRWSREEKERLVAATLEPGRSFGNRAVGRHPCQPAFPVAQAALRGRRRRLATGSGRDRGRCRSRRSRHSSRSLIPGRAGKRARRRSSSAVAVGCGWRATLTPRHSAGSSIYWSGDDPGPERREGLAGHRPHGHAQRLTTGCRRWREKVLKRIRTRPSVLFPRASASDLIKVVW